MNKDYYGYIYRTTNLINGRIYIGKRKGLVEKRNLIEAPFTQLHPMGIKGIFTSNDINEILEFTNSLIA
ncbi:MAG: hypothetical protein ABSG25_07860 [Bryobacteraceae bacterium]|jgi:hypothetical protein